MKRDFVSSHYIYLTKMHKIDYWRYDDRFYDRRAKLCWAKSEIAK